jgi:HD-GYP domain-containing protein (c-di-GMP phosphodiesterase class II)
LIKPLIEADNIERVFRQSVEEGERISQIRTKIHNVATIGLTATIAKTDITEAIYSHTLDILINSVSLLSQRDNYTASHSSRVFYYCKHIAGKLGLTKNKKFLRDLYFAALLHDVGKIGIRDDVLLKPDSLNKEEFNDLSSHPVKAYRLLQPHSFLRGASELVRFHHERVDGRGYPDKLKGNRIPLGSSIIAVADSFDAMTTTRPYRKTLTYDKALSEISRNLGTQYNIDAGEAFLSVITPSLMDEVKNLSRRPLHAISQELISNILM